jgi:hypothetical protein
VSSGASRWRVLEQRHAAYQFHREIVLTIRRAARFIDPGDHRVRQPGEYLDFTAEHIEWERAESRSDASGMIRASS